MEKDRYNEIRVLLGRYYSGSTDGEEERRLAEFFAGAGELPADLEADRALFGAMALDESELPELPEEYGSRISEAVEAEMAAERGRRNVSAAWRRKLTAWGAAACVALLLASAAMFMFMHEEPKTQGVTAKVQGPALTAKTVRVSEAAEAAEAAPGAVKPQEKRNGRKGAVKPTVKPAVKAPRNVAAGYEYDAGESDYYAGGYDAEEERLMADNYRVVDDEREAYAIVSSIFSRLEGNMALESNRISEIRGDYEMEVEKLSY